MIFKLLDQIYLVDSSYKLLLGNYSKMKVSLRYYLIYATMENNPELNGKYLGSISQDFVVVAETLKEASYQIRSREFSNFPIFPISKVEIPIGKLLVGRGEMATNWYYYVTYLDEFTQRKLITNEDDFKKAYKNPDEFCCLFVVDQDFTNFLFIPYPED